MVADGLIPAVHVRPSGQELTEIIADSTKIMGQLPDVSDRVASFRNRLMSEAETLNFAIRALDLRYAHRTLAPIRPELLSACGEIDIMEFVGYGRY